MSGKPEYLPTADHFNAWLMDNKDFIFDIFDEVHGTGNGNWKHSILNSGRNPSINISFEVPADGNNGFWDVVFTLRSVDMFKMVLGEYKTSLEESNVESVIRQIKKRGSRCEDMAPCRMTGESIILTFDPRFERYRKVIENEDISLKVFDSTIRRKLDRKFGKSSSRKNSLDEF